MHLAELWGSSDLVEYLLSVGANPDAFDAVGRQPRNMTFKDFNANSKKAAHTRLSLGTASPEDNCEIPEVTIPLIPQTGMDDATSAFEKSATIYEWQDSVIFALSEVRRLVSEGEPVMVRNVMPWLQAGSPGPGAVSDKPMAQQPAYLTAAAFAEVWGHRPVDVGSMPYAKIFDLSNERTTLKDYMKATATADTADRDAGTAKRDAQARFYPNYVFQIDTEACAEGHKLFRRIVEAALPASGENPIICPPAKGLHGLESVHYYLGGIWSGAPFHIHSDAINLAVSGKKKWWVVTPRSAVWSRRHIREYAEGGKGGPWKDEDRPMECVQRGGDLVYVPGEWGHAAMNLEDGTFG